MIIIQIEHRDSTRLQNKLLNNLKRHDTHNLHSAVLLYMFRMQVTVKTEAAGLFPTPLVITHRTVA
jgi:hypothetical protein